MKVSRLDMFNLKSFVKFRYELANKILSLVSKDCLGSREYINVRLFISRGNSGDRF